LIRLLIRFAAAIAVMAVIAITVLFIFQRRLIFPVPAGGPFAVDGFKSVDFETSDGLTLHALYRPTTASAPTVVFFHGNGDNLVGSAKATAALGQAGYGLLLVEYRGYAGNPGRPSEQGVYADGRAALGWLNTHGIEQRDIVLIGNSLGSGTAVQMALEHRGALLILISGFANFADLVAEKFGVPALRLLVLDKFDSAAKLAHVEIPVLLLHGTSDRVVPVDNAARLAAASRYATVELISGVGHELAYLPIAGRSTLAWLANKKFASHRSVASTDHAAQANSGK